MDAYALSIKFPARSIKIPCPLEQGIYP